MTQMLSHHDIHEAAHLRLEALREKAAKRHRETGHKPFSLRGALLSWRKEITRRTLRNDPAPTPPSPSMNQL